MLHSSKEFLSALTTAQSIRWDSGRLTADVLVRVTAVIGKAWTPAYLELTDATVIAYKRSTREPIQAINISGKLRCSSMRLDQNKKYGRLFTSKVADRNGKTLFRVSSIDSCNHAMFHG